MSFQTSNKDPYGWQPWFKVGSTIYKCSWLYISLAVPVSQVPLVTAPLHFSTSMSDSEKDVVKSTNKGLTLEDIMRAIQANSEQSAAQEARMSQQSAAQESRLSHKIVSSRDEILSLVSQDIDKVRDDMRIESRQHAQDVRVEFDNKFQSVHNDVDSARDSAAAATAQCEYLILEVVVGHYKL